MKQELIHLIGEADLNPRATKKLFEIEEEIVKLKMGQASFDPVSMQKEKQTLLKDVSI